MSINTLVPNATAPTSWNLDYVNNSCVGPGHFAYTGYSQVGDSWPIMPEGGVATCSAHVGHTWACVPTRRLE